MVCANGHGADELDGGDSEQGSTSYGNGGSYHDVGAMLKETGDDGGLVES